MNPLMLLLTILLVAQFTYIIISVLRRRWLARQNMDGLLYALSLKHSSLEVGEAYDLTGLWQDRPVEIKMIQHLSIKRLIIEMETGHPNEWCLIMTPQVELFDARSHMEPLLSYFSLLHYPQSLMSSLRLNKPGIDQLFINTWLEIDPEYPYNCFHKVEKQRQTLCLPGDCDLHAAESALNMLSALEKHFHLSPSPQTISIAEKAGTV